MHVFFLPLSDQIDIMPNNTYGIEIEKFCNSVWSIGCSLSDLSNTYRVIWAMLNEWLTVKLRKRFIKKVDQEMHMVVIDRLFCNSVANFSLKKISIESQVFMSTIRQCQTIDIIYYLHLENSVWIQSKSNFSIFLRSWGNEIFIVSHSTIRFINEIM